MPSGAVVAGAGDGGAGVGVGVGVVVVLVVADGVGAAGELPQAITVRDATMDTASTLDFTGPS